jgi:hypothetical protein
MRAAVVLSILAAVPTLAGCRTRPLDARADGGAILDGDGGSCARRQLSTIPVTAINPDDLNVWEGAVARATIVFRRLSCAPPVAPLVRLDTAQRTVTITARVFASPDDLASTACAEVVEKQTIDLAALGPLAPGPLTLRDGSPIGVASQEIPILAPPTTSCALPAGGRCQLDCQCASASAATPRCWVDSGGACVRTCATDADCDPSAPICSTGICVATGPGCGAPSARCPIGARCTDVNGHAACKPAQTARAGAPCATDRDCDFGGVCGAGCACVLPCVTDRDCPSGRCDEVRGACE